MTERHGPLAGIRVVEFDAIGPVPFAGMMLADMGADVVRIARPGREAPQEDAVVDRGRRIVSADLKNPQDRDRVLDLLEHADVLLEGLRPGVMERLRLGPDTVLGRNKALVYGRMTGWGQSGPLARAAGHDLNYVAITGAISAIGSAGRPAIPLNLVGDYGGGAMFLIAGVLSALLHAKSKGTGQVVDAAMCDGAAMLMSPIYEMMGSGMWADQRASNILDGGSPWYDIYTCADGGHVTICAIEPQFYADLLERLDLSGHPAFADQHDTSAFPEMRRVLTETFLRRSRQAWCDALEGTDVCFAPVMSMSEVATHPHNAARGIFRTLGSVRAPAPAPRFTATPSRMTPSRADTFESVSDSWRE
ncbi:MAG: CaiB/BaiF CoA transferase family protein [Sagittula sp.]|uniref:CaiB/BaiF CoA transferase family protein n=1 Tax=Sagittula sp. TaxID=2038081 RepID=UPI004058905A